MIHVLYNILDNPIGMVCCYCCKEVSENQMCCSEVHQEMAYETEDGEIILESELT